MAFKIALSAGHGKNTLGKRCLKSLDPNETREWVLNDRIADRIEALLKDYDGYHLTRVDDTTGVNDVPLSTRVNLANQVKADFYLSIHHNAGVNGGAGGGVMAFVYNGNVSDATLEWQRALYDMIVDATGLKGNRSEPLARSNLYECRKTNMPAVLLELGFMDSSTDVPIILSEEFANKCAVAIVKVLVARGGLTKKANNAIYKVQVGAYSNRSNAERMKEMLEADGYNAYITT